MEVCKSCKNLGYNLKTHTIFCSAHQRNINKNDKGCKTGYLPLDNIKSEKKKKNETQS